MVEPKSPRSPPSTTSHTLASCGDSLDERVYRAIKEKHPGMEIDADAVDHIRNLMERLLREMMSDCPGNVYELEKKCAALFSPQKVQEIYQKWSESCDRWSSRLHRAMVAKDRQLHERLVLFIKETLSSAVRRDAKELERMALYLLTSVDCLAVDLITWVGNYVKKLRESGVNIIISLQNVKISLLADPSLMQLNELLHRPDDDAGTSGQSMIFDFDTSEQMSPRAMLKLGAARRNKSYQEATAQFLSEERAYLRELNMLVNVFLRRFENVMQTTKEEGSYMEDIFGNITELHELSRKLERAIEDARELNDPFSAGAGLWELAEANEFDVYHQYVKHISSGAYLDMIAKVLTVRKYASSFESEAKPYTRQRDTPGTGASSYAASSASAVATSASFFLAVRYVLPQLLLVPIVHFFKYVEQCTRLHAMSQNDDDRGDLANTRNTLTALAVRIEKTCAMNGTIQKRMKIEQSLRMAADSMPGSGGTPFDRILDIEKGIDGYMGEPIARTCRELIKEGDLRMVRPSVISLTQESLRRRWSTDRHVYVFDQLIVLCKSHKTGWKFKDRLSLRTAEIRDLEDTEVLQNAFKVEGKEKERGKGGAETSRHYAYTFVCGTPEEKEAWMEAMIGIQSRSLLDRMLDAYLKEEKQKVPLLMPPHEHYPFAEPDSDENIVFEDYTSSSGMPVVKHGTIVKLVERLTHHSTIDIAYVRTFLISYRSFCKPSRLLELLILRFDVPLPKVLQQGSDAKPSLFASSNAFRDMAGNGSAAAAGTTAAAAAAANVGAWRSGGPLAGRFDTVQSHGLSGSPNVGGASGGSSSAREPSIYTGFLHTSLVDQSIQRFKKEYVGPVQLRVLNVLRKWVVDHWYDFEADHELLEGMQDFLTKILDAKRPVSAQLRKFSKNVLSIVRKKVCASTGTTPAPTASEGHFNFAFDRDDEPEEETIAERRRRIAEVNNFQPKKPDPPVWHVAKKGDTSAYDLLSLHPLEIGRQLTLIHFDLYRAIKPIELVGQAWMKSDKYKKSPQLLKLTDHSTQLTYWVSRSIVETESLEERVAMFSRVLEVMTVFEELHNFTGLVAFYSALNKACVHRLTWCWDRLDSEKQKCYDRFEKLCNPHWTEMVKRLQSINPPCVPFFGHYLTSIVFYDSGNTTFVNIPGNDMRQDQQDNESLLVSFLKCRRIANVISEIQMYQNEPYCLKMEESIRVSDHRFYGLR
uniref:Sos-1 n=1 Tax=Pristionchus pacificus TaxID=54126 RepID=A0A2A6CS60_PRIPA|eukprot:PDM80979.1 sos-1 [Pristionchus pacificus]